MTGSLVAAGVVLAGYQHQARARWFRFQLAVADRVQNSHERRVGGNHAKTDGYGYGEAENEGHEERDHLSSTFSQRSLHGHFPLLSLITGNLHQSFAARIC